MKPVVDGLQQSYDDQIDFVIYGELDKDAAASTFASAQGVQGVPTTVLVAPDGKEVKRWIGPKTDDELRAEVDNALFSLSQ
ncbi:MAG: thioredoxin family protein [Coriobacteriia bacterium]|nr:thioredoxin family protein [Coriobacteriia bacterium]